MQIYHRSMASVEQQSEDTSLSQLLIHHIFQKWRAAQDIVSFLISMRPWSIILRLVAKEHS